MKYPESNMDFGKNDTIYHPLQEGKRRVHQFFSLRALHIVTATKSLQADTWPERDDQEGFWASGGS